MIRLAESVLLSRVDDEFVLLDSAAGVYYGLNGVGSRMVELLMESGDIETVVRRIVVEYPASEDRVRADLLELLGDLRTKKLIRDDDPA